MRAIKTEDAVVHAHEYDVDLKSNNIFLFGIDTYAYSNATEGAEPGVEFSMANRLIRNLFLCKRANPEQPIVIHMKTCGGDWSEGMAIYDAIKSFPCPVTILSYTHARSMSSLIFQAANKRVMMPNSYFMFHDGTYDVSGTVKSVKSSVEFGKISEKTMMDIYASIMSKHGSFAGKSEKTIRQWLRGQMDRKEEVYLTAEKALELGFCDEIFNNDWESLISYTDEQLSR